MGGLPAILVTEPHEFLFAVAEKGCRAAGGNPVNSITVIDSSEHLHEEAPLLDESELADAQAALIEDGIMADGEPIQTAAATELTPDQHLRALVRYGWALAHLERTESEKSAGGNLVWSIRGSSLPPSEQDLRFLLMEMQRRALPAKYLAFTWPMTIEPAVDFEPERREIFVAFVEKTARSFHDAGVGMLIPHAGYKLSVLQEVAALLGERALLEIGGMAAMESARLISRVAPALFRRMLTSAQQHFAFDKGRVELSTTESDIYPLPEVSDPDLERIFLEDPRGRQLLSVTAASSFADHSLGAELIRFLRHESTSLDELVTERFRQHLELCAACGKG